jgi:hypothetical protein
MCLHPVAAVLFLYLLTAGEERATVALKGKISKDSLTDLIKSENLPPTIKFSQPAAAAFA